MDSSSTAIRSTKFGQLRSHWRRSGGGTTILEFLGANSKTNCTVVVSGAQCPKTVLFEARRADFWASEFARILTHRSLGDFGQGEVFEQVPLEPRGDSHS